MSFASNIVQSVKSFASNVWQGAWNIGGVRIPTNPAIQFFMYDGDLMWTGAQSATDLKTIFTLCTPVSSTIDAKADAFATGVFEVINANTGNFVRGEKALKWQGLFDKPNPLQSKKQFLRQVYLYTQLYGFALVFKNYAVGFRDIPYSMWVLPPWLLWVDEINVPIFLLKPDDILSRIHFLFGGEKIPINKEDLMLISDPAATISDRTLMPMSRLTNLTQPVSIALSTIEAELTMIQRKGAIGILSNRAADQSGSVPLKKGEKDDLQNEFRGYGLTRNQKQVIITSANLSWQSMTFPVRDLMLHESYVKAYKDICAGYGFPFTLVPHADQSTYNNIKTDSLRLYQDTIMPEADDLAEQLMKGLNADADNVAFSFNYIKNPVFHQTEKDRGDGLKALNQGLEVAWNAGLITLNDWNIALEKDKISLPEFDMYKPEYDRYIAENIGAQYIPNSKPSQITVDSTTSNGTIDGTAGA